MPTPPPTTLHPDDDCLFDPSFPKCVPGQNGLCPDGFNMNEDGNCFPNKPCPSGYAKLDYDETGRCWSVVSPTDGACPPGYEKQSDDEAGRCWKQVSPPTRPPTRPPTPKPSDCTGTYHYDNKSKTCVLNSNCKEGTGSSTNSTSSTKTVYCTETDVKTKKVYIKQYPVYRQNIINYITVPNAIKNFTDNVIQRQLGKTPAFLLLLDTRQLYHVAKDFQCELQQNKFNTIDLTTNPNGKGNWLISGKVQNVVKNPLSNIKVTATFYDTLGNNMGSYTQGSVTPTKIDSLQYGIFNLKATRSAQNWNPVFLRVEYQAS